MAIDKERSTIGSGITRRRQVYSRLDLNTDVGAETFASAMRERNEELYKPWAGKRRLIDRARARLSELEKSLPRAVDDLEAFNTHYRERDSELWYLWQIDICASVAEAAIQEGRPWEAVEQAMLIGEYLTELRIKSLWDEFAMAGKKAKDSSAFGAEMRRRRPAADRCAEVQRLVDEGKTLSRAFALVGKRERSSPSTIKRDWYAQHPKKNLSKPVN